MAQALQHRPPSQRPGLPTAGTRKLRPNGPIADHALTFNPDHSVGAAQRRPFRARYDRHAQRADELGSRSFVTVVIIMFQFVTGSLDAELHNAPVGRELIFNRRFFERLARKIDVSRHPSPPLGDRSEYDKEDAEQARRERLGVTPSSHYLNIGVDNQVTCGCSE